MAAQVEKPANKNELLTFVLVLEDPANRNWIAGAIWRRFGDKLNHDELGFIVIYVNGPIASMAAERLFNESVSPQVLGTVAKFFPQFETEAWAKVQEIFPTKDDILGRKIFLGFCPQLSAKVRDEEFRRLNYHLEMLVKK